MSEPSSAAIPFDPDPSWTSSETYWYFTGAELADVNGDGFPEFISSAGNDMYKSPNFAWFNNAGVLSTVSWWESDDNEYSGHCDAGDLDGDGLPELVVATYIDDGWTAPRSCGYSNNGGYFETAPSWVTDERFYSFSCALGDADGDGDLDAAFACGEEYTGRMEHNRIYINNSGALETSASWTSAYTDACYDVYWVDVDADGDLDLTFISSSGPVYIHFSDGGALETSPSWQSSGFNSGNSLCWGDIDNNGYPDLVAAYNYQLGGDGYFEVYMNENGVPETSPSWRSDTEGYGAAVLLADFDFDGDLDLAAGRWWDQLRIYENMGGFLTTTPAWQCGYSWDSVAEELCVGDVDTDGVRCVFTEHKQVDGERRVFTLANQPAETVLEVVADGVSLDMDEWCADPEAGWVSLAAAPALSLSIGYTFSMKPDIGLSNWDRENYLFENTSVFDAPLAVRLRGRNLPVTIPAGGGRVSFECTIVNNLAAATAADAWVTASAAGGGPRILLGKQHLFLETEQSITSTAITRNVPGSLAAGDYMLALYGGVYPDAPADSSFLFLVKE